MSPYISVLQVANTAAVHTHTHTHTHTFVKIYSDYHLSMDQVIHQAILTLKKPYMLPKMQNQSATYSAIAT